MAEHAKEQEKPAPYSIESMTAVIEAWEKHLDKSTPQHANGEFAHVQEAVRKVGVRLSHRATAENRNRCAQCHKPLSDRGPFMTIPIYDLNIADWRNQHACSQKCSDLLQTKAREVQMKMSAGG